MPPTSCRPGTSMPASGPSADELNETIRALMRRAYGRPLWDDESAEYARLLTLWEAAVRAELVRAA